MQIKTGIGQDSHRFVKGESDRKLVLGGVTVEGAIPLDGNSDADVVLHAITNAVSGVTGVNILGPISDRMCLDEGITDSREYLREALKYLNGFTITHVSMSIECQKPRITPLIPAMKDSIATLLGLKPADVGITATTGEGLTDFGRGEGIQVLVVVTAIKEK